MVIISTETKASAAPPGNNTGLSFNLSNQQETYQGPAEDGVASLIKAEQFAAWQKISLCTDLLVVAESRATTHDAFTPSTYRFHDPDPDPDPAFTLKVQISRSAGRAQCRTANMFPVSHPARHQPPQQ